MPLYEYYCESCNGVFEALRQMAEASEPAPCPLCDRDGVRIMPTSVAMFTFRDGYPRRIPDKGTYWHWDGREVKTLNKGGVPANEHPELYKPDPGPTPTKGDREEQRDINFYKRRHLARLKDAGDRPALGGDGKPILDPKKGM